jgi:disulfide bond formation protein DsbB
MSTATASVFFALLSLLCVTAVIVVSAAALVRRSRPDSPVGGLVDDLGPVALWLAWIVALVTTLGSLYYSEIADFVPCELCWFQRIAMYPLAVLLLIAAVRRDRGIWIYVVPQAAIGAAIAVYHTQLQAFPEQSTFCATTTPCTTRYVWEFGFVSLPFMALAAFAFVITMVLVARATDPAADDRDDLPVLEQAGTR